MRDMADNELQQQDQGCMTVCCFLDCVSDVRNGFVGTAAETGLGADLHVSGMNMITCRIG